MNFAHKLIALTSLTEKEIHRFFRVWPQSLFSPALKLTIYLIIFKSLFDFQNISFNSSNYLNFVIPGLIIMGTMTSSFDNVSLSFFNAKFRRTIDDIIASPMTPTLILLGYILGGVFRGLVVSIISILISILFVETEIIHPFLMFYTIITTSISFSILGLLSAYFVNDFDELYFIPNFILVPLTLLGGVFHTVESLPLTLQQLSHLNPISYLIDAIRFSFIGVKDINILNFISVTILINVLLFYCARRLFVQKLQHQ